MFSSFSLRNRFRHAIELLDVRHHISAYVFLSIFSSAVVISTLLIISYSLNAIDSSSQISIQNGQNVVDTIAAQLDSHTSSLSQTHTLLLSSDGIRAYLESASNSTPSYEWFRIYNDAREMLILCARSQYNLIVGTRLTLATGENIRYGSLDSIPALTANDCNKLLLLNGHAFYASVFSGTDGRQNFLLSQMYNSVIDDMCNGLVMPESALLLLDEEGKVFQQYAIDEKGRNKLLLYHSNASASLQSVLAPFGNGRFEAIMLLPATSLSESLRSVAPYLLPMTLFTLFSSFLLSYLLSRKVKKGFEVMENNIRLVEQCAYNDVTIIHTQDEFGKLSHTFAHMALHIDELISENQEHQRIAHELEIQVLRAQISPHFLSNALNSVRSLAVMQGDEHIERLIGAIIQLLRASLESTDTLVTLAQEMEYVRNYVEICQYQYLNDIQVDFFAEESLLNCLMPPMILQPIVENSIIHGIADFRSEGMIRINAQRQDDMLLLSVTDNGQGMSSEQIRTLLSQERNMNKRRFSGIGLQNVQRRIRMRFGADYGLHIVSQPQEYTTVQIILPYKEHFE